MTKNIKEIGKELLGKSLNSFHRKTGLTQLEKNNEMQDGILNGILSQVDDAYIEKTEQSNVIHLDGNGDGIVVVDGVEGNTIVNLVKLPEVNERTRNTSSAIICLQIGNSSNSINLKTNATYTCFVSYDIKNISSNCQTYMEGQIKNSDNSLAWFSTSDRPNSVGSYRIVKKVDTSNISKTLNNFYVAIRSTDGQDANATIKLNNIMFLEGDWTDKEIPPYFEGLQSSFEEKVNDEGEYEIEILSRCNNLINTISNAHEIKPIYSYYGDKLNEIKPYLKYFNLIDSYNNCNNLYDYYYTDGGLNIWINLGTKDKYKALEVLNKRIAEGMNKSNKIKLLINEPLRAIGDVKDRLCVKDGRLVVERNCGQVVLDGGEDWAGSNKYGIYTEKHDMARLYNYSHAIACDKLPTLPSQAWSTDIGVTGYAKSSNYEGQNWLYVMNPDFTTTTDLKRWLSQNPLKVVYPLVESICEEVFNEYGEPILLEGYENGTLYIDSTIIPTTSVRYTPKMESFKTIREVKDNNIMLTTDINDAIIPYMLEVDMMILEKEMAIMSHKNIRKIGEKDMTNMQKRTYDMLARLIKGKTLNEQECKTRVTVYLNAGKITEEQAKELNFLIDEIYA